MLTKEEREIKRAEKLQEKEEKKNLKIYEKYMGMALKEAKKAYNINEVPIGCVIVRDDKVIAKGYNRRNIDKNVLAHAEIAAIREACKKTGDWRLEDCTLYVTLEPCQMCSGAIVQARIPNVVIGAMNPKAGCAGSIINLLNMDQFNHQCQVQRGILEEECTNMMTKFFQELREQKNQVM
ncbi:MAG: tRNA adenosine(34) deaminase TadA [Pseudobutyrivibrio sp.]|nr:tRNA adenosine(34) deaminase TadA [Pseudobutyrivibrio sp.]